MIFLRYARELLGHLRLPMQAVLTPIFLLGGFLGNGTPGLDWILPIVAVHVGLYGGATAFNSYCDRDQGPIAFCRRPRPVSRPIRDGALVLQVVSIGALARVEPLAGVIALVLAIMGVAYSHPRWRWKASTAGSLATVAIGQGAGAFFLGAVTIGGAGAPAFDLATAALGSALLVTGIYPVTQLYQIDEDCRRGDQTLGVRYGWRVSLWFSGLLISAGILVLGLVLRRHLSGEGLVSLTLAFLALAVALRAWAARFERQSPEENFDWSMRICVTASLFFFAVLGALLHGSSHVGVSRGSPGGEPSAHPLQHADSSSIVVTEMASHEGI